MLNQPLTAPPKTRYVLMGCGEHWTVYDQLQGICLTPALSEDLARASADKRETAWNLACLRSLLAEWRHQ